MTPDWQQPPSSSNKRIDTVERYERETEAPGPAREYIDVHTADDWTYRFKRLTPEEPFQFVYKRNPDGQHKITTRDDVVPQAVDAWFDDTAGVELTDHLTIERRDDP